MEWSYTAPLRYILIVVLSYSPPHNLMSDCLRREQSPLITLHNTAYRDQCNLNSQLYTCCVMLLDRILIVKQCQSSCSESDQVSKMIHPKKTQIQKKRGRHGNDMQTKNKPPLYIYMYLVSLYKAALTGG